MANGTKIVCDDLEEASRSSFTNPGWAYHAVLTYLTYLCGDDCAIRLDRHQISLEEIRFQAISNLKQAFSVVGLLNETDVFYDMVSARVAYVDMKLNPDVVGARHSAGKSKENQRCKAKYADPAFQAEFKEHMPLMGVLEEAYHVAIQVNRDQLTELQECPGFGKAKHPAHVGAEETTVEQAETLPTKKRRAHPNSAVR